MNKLKDIFYDKNDILIALIILCFAALIISFRVHAIMEYPKTLVAGTTPSVSEPENPGTSTGGAVSPEGPVEMCSIYINSGDSIQTIGSNFVAAGIFNSVEEFTQLVTELGVATQIKTGNFILPADSTSSAAIEVILKPGL